jgi:glycosyltransferase involved in cell wall biosynthesis
LERNFFKTVPAPLLVSKGEVNKQTVDSDNTPRIVSYQRADKVKGGLRLPPIFEMLASKGFKCEVALDSSIDGDTRYSDQLFKEVAPWLVGERKDRMWLQHGDVFILSSFSEAAALSAQEAVYRGCYVVSSNVGIIEELSQKVPVIRVIDPWSTDSVCKEVLEIASLPAVQRTQEIHVSQCELSSMSGKWIEFVTALVVDLSKVRN